MGVAAYRGFTASTGKQLAQVVYKRCKHNVAEYARKHPGHDADCRDWHRLDLGRGDEGYEFVIGGYAPADKEKWLSDWTRDYGAADAKSADRMYGGKPPLLMHGRAYGYMAIVKMKTKIAGEPAFDVKVSTQGTRPVPPEIIRCLESTYNEIKEGFGR